MKIKRKTLVFLKLWTIRLLVTSIIVGGFYVYFRTHMFTVTTYELRGVPSMYTETIDSSLRAVASHKIFKLFPGNRIVPFDNAAIKSAIVDVLPNTGAINILPVGLHTLRITVTNYEPIFKIDETRGVTKDGIIYSEFKDIHALPTLFIASSTLEDGFNHGIHVVRIKGINDYLLSDLSNLINKINTTLFFVSKVYIDGYSDVTLYDEDGVSKIVFSSESDMNKVWSNIVSAIDTEPLKSELSNTKDRLDYLDARFGNKVFYKFTKDYKNTILKSHEATTTIATTTIPQ